MRNLRGLGFRVSGLGFRAPPRQEEEELIEYDLLIGSDGVRSRVREAMNSQLPPGPTEGLGFRV